MPPTYANGHISATGDPIHFMFGSMVGFSGTALFSIRAYSRWRWGDSYSEYIYPCDKLNSGYDQNLKGWDP